MNVLANGAAWLHAQRHSSMSVNVSYQRAAGGDPLGIQATIGRTLAEDFAESELVTSAGVRDYLFRAEDFITDSVLIPPASRDTITEGDGQAWEVVEIPGEPVWRYSDEYRNAIRVHTAKR